MRRPSRDATITLGFVALSFALAFWQRPGDATSDTKIDLHVDPAAFLDRVLSAWNPSMDLGAVQTAQYSGFLWPMSSFFAAAARARRLAMGHGAAVAGADPRPLGVGRPAPARRPRRPAARHRTPGRGGLLRPEPLHRRLHGPHDLRARRLRGTALAPADRPVRRAGGARVARGLARLVVGGGLRAHPHLAGRRHQRRRRRLDAGRAAAPAALRADGRCRALARLRPASCCASASSARWRRCGGSSRSSCTPASAWTSCSSPSSRARSGRPATPPRRCASWATGRRTSASASTASTRRCSPSRGRCCSTRWWSAPRCCIPALAVAGFVWTRRMPYAPFLLLVLLAGAAIEVAGFPDGTPARSGDGLALPQRPDRRLHAHDAEGGAARGDRRRRAARPRRPRRLGAAARAVARRACARPRWWARPPRWPGSSSWPRCRSCAAPRSRSR